MILSNIYPFFLKTEGPPYKNPFPSTSIIKAKHQERNGQQGKINPEVAAMVKYSMLELHISYSSRDLIQEIVLWY
jgi:hypothetical protein